VIIPAENEKDLKEVPEAIMKDLEIIRVEHMDQVLENALGCADPDKLFCGRGEDTPHLSVSLMKDAYQPQTRH
jgi:ATP-dependent Lon protease